MSTLARRIAALAYPVAGRIAPRVSPASRIATAAAITAAIGTAIAAAPAAYAGDAIAAAGTMSSGRHDGSAERTRSGTLERPRSDALEHPRSHRSLLRESARDGSVVVALFSLEGCAYCAAIRSDQLRHLAREARERNLRVVEYEINDRRAFRDAGGRSNGSASAPSPASPASPADLADRLGVRVAPTVVFLGPDGDELAERLVGYSSPDFYGAYLERRVATARERLASN